jgi:hypothetical protein
MFVIIFMSSGGSFGGEGSLIDETKNMGQAHQATTGGDNGGGNGDGANTLQGFVDKAAGDINQAEKDQLAQSEGELNSALDSVGNVSNVNHSIIPLGGGGSCCFL